MRMKLDIKGMEETLRFWRHGSRPLRWEGRVGSELKYALRMHEDVYHLGRMLEEDARKVAAGINPLSGRRLKWGKRRRAAYLRGVAANLALLHKPTPEGMPGRKYLTRVLLTHAKMYVDSARDILPHAIAVMARAEGVPLTDAFSLVAEEFVKRVVMHITQRATDNAPFWHGDLRRSLMGYVGRQLVAQGPRQPSLAHWRRIMEKAPNVRKYSRAGALLLASLARE